MKSGNKKYFLLLYKFLHNERKVKKYYQKTPSNSSFNNSSRHLFYIFYFLLSTFYSILSLVKHTHFLTEYDLGIEDQVVWNYSRFQVPILTAVFVFSRNRTKLWTVVAFFLAIICKEDERF